MFDKVIYIPTITTRRKITEYQNCLYSPTEKNPEIILAENITIWDNHTFYLRSKLRSSFKQEIAYEHYLWFIEFIKQNWKEGIYVITPDVDWMNYEWAVSVEQEWKDNCSEIPQLFVPESWRTDYSNLNVIGYALQEKSKKGIYHPLWTHCLGHKREIPESRFVTYDKSVPILK